MGGINCSWPVDPTPQKRESGTVGFPSLLEILHIPVWGTGHLNTPDRWKENRSGKGIDPQKLWGSLKFWGHKMGSGWELAKLWGGHCFEIMVCETDWQEICWWALFGIMELWMLVLFICSQFPWIFLVIGLGLYIQTSKDNFVLAPGG